MNRYTDPTGSPEQSQLQSAGRPSPSRKRARRVLLPPILVVIGVSAALAYILTTGGPHAAASSTRLAGATSSASLPQASASSSAQPTQTANSANAAEPRSAAALAASGGALALQDGLTTQAATWADGSGGTRLAAVSSQLGTVMQAAGMRQYVEMKAACVRLASTVKAAQAGPPIPEASMQAVYAGALTDLATGAANCQAAISQQTDGDEYIITHENSTMLKQSASAFAAAAKDLFRATAEIEIAGRHQ